MELWVTWGQRIQADPRDSHSNLVKHFTTKLYNWRASSNQAFYSDPRVNLSQAIQAPRLLEHAATRTVAFQWKSGQPLAVSHSIQLGGWRLGRVGIRSQTVFSVTSERLKFAMWWTNDELSSVENAPDAEKSVAGHVASRLVFAFIAGRAATGLFH